MSSSESKGKANSPRFHDYLAGLQEEYERQFKSPTSAKNIRFNIYILGLKGEYELIAEDLVSLRNERDEYKEKVEAQAKELQNVSNILCERCSKALGTTSPGIAASFHEKFTTTTPFKPFIDPTAADTSQGVDPTPETITRRSNQPIITTLPSQSILHTMTQASDTRSRATTPPISTIYPDSGSDQLDWSIKFNYDADKELDVELAHVLSHQYSIFYVNFSQDGKFLAAGCRDGKVYIYMVQTGSLICVLRDLLAEDDTFITSVCFDHHAKYLATGTSDGDIYIWEIKTKYVRNAFKSHNHWIGSLRFSPNGRQLVSASDDNTARLWNMRDGASIILTDNLRVINTPYYTSAVFSPDGKYVAASHRDGVVRIWNARTCQLTRRVNVHVNPVNGIAYMPDGQGLVSGGSAMPLKYWDVSSFDTGFRASLPATNGLRRHLSGDEQQTRPEREFSGCHEDSIRSLAISGDGRWLAASSMDNIIHFWDTHNAAVQFYLNSNVDGEIWTLDFSPVGRYLASCGDSGTVRIWSYSYITPQGS